MSSATESTGAKICGGAAQDMITCTATGDFASIENNPTLSIVIVDSDGADDTLRCLDSIFSHPPEVLFEVILIDNCSQSSCLPLVQNRYPQVRTGFAPARQGFAKNYNIGIRLARGEYVLILNNDTAVHANALNAMLVAMYAHREYWMVGPQLLWPDGRIQTVCARSLKTPFSYSMELLFLDLSFPLGKLWEVFRRRQLARRDSGSVPCISGACMLLTRTALNATGLLNEAYDFYFEDVEWCYRIQAQGATVAYIAEAKVTHYADKSLSKAKVWAKQSEYRSAIRYFQQYYRISLLQTRLIWLVTVTTFLMRWSAFSLIEFGLREQRYAAEYKELFKWILTQFPARTRAALSIDD